MLHSHYINIIHSLCKCISTCGPAWQLWKDLYHHWICLSCHVGSGNTWRGCYPQSVRFGAATELATNKVGTTPHPLYNSCNSNSNNIIVEITTLLPNGRSCGIRLVCSYVGRARWHVMRLGAVCVLVCLSSPYTTKERHNTRLPPPWSSHLVWLLPHSVTYKCPAWSPNNNDNSNNNNINHNINLDIDQPH